MKKTYIALSAALFLAAAALVSCSSGSSSSDNADMTAPSVPGGLLASAVSSTQIRIAWSASTDNVAVTGYKVYRSNAQLSTTTTTSYVDSGLTAATQYCYQVSAFDAAGNASAKCTQACATTAANTSTSGGLLWPLNCIPGTSCSSTIGYPDIDGDGKAFNCGPPGYMGHQGTDINTSWSNMDAGISVYAAADGVVQWVFDGKFDRCPDPSQPDCQNPPGTPAPGSLTGTTVCTALGPYCGTGTGSCYWCFAGGNVVVIRHDNVHGVFATRYDHLKKNSILVTSGQVVTKGQKIAELGSAGNSTGPHLHFEVWGSGFYQLADPWAGPCGPNFDSPLWKNEPPWLP